MEGRANLRARATRIVFNETRDLTSALIMVDSSRARWDEAFLKALYHTEQTDKHQLGEIKTTMIEGLLPR